MNEPKYTWAVALAGCILVGGGCERHRNPTVSTAGDRQTSPAGIIGERLDAFDFETVDGKRLAWEAETGVLHVEDNRYHPTAFLVHVFQPDCDSCQSQARALEDLRQQIALEDVAIAGIAYRGDDADVAAFVDRFDVGYPIVSGAGEPWADKWSRGDPMYLVDAAGKIVYSQVGFEESDPDVWRMVLDDLAAGREAAFQHPQRAGRRLSVGDSLPTIAFPDLMTGRPMSLRVDEGKLVFADENGQSKTYKAAIGFFSRY
jgi:hypothetical protein